MAQLTIEQAEAIEQNHNVCVDIESEQFNRDSHDSEYGWDVIPDEWIKEVCVTIKDVRQRFLLSAVGLVMRNDLIKERRMKLRVWWIPQVPGKPFHVDVGSVAEGVKVVVTLAQYDLFQLENNIKPDYCNAGGLQLFDPTDTEDGPDGSWVDWYDEETGEDDPEAWLQDQAA
jgi:hypothetical protein